MVRKVDLGREWADCPAPYHGTMSAYSSVGCRCPHAREAWRLYRKRLRERRQPPGRVSGLGAWRRSRALARMGWPGYWQFAQLGRAPGHERWDPNRTIMYEYHIGMIKLYDQYRDQRGPSDWIRQRAEKWHERDGDWYAPSDWDLAEDIDDPNSFPVYDYAPSDAVEEMIVVSRALDPGMTTPEEVLRRNPRGDDLRLARAVIREAVRRGMSQADIDKVSGINPKRAVTLAAGIGLTIRKANR
jgi:hypothetical protein